MKHEWRKKEKELYLPKNKPTIIDIPKCKYLTIEGKGNPNDDEFKTCVSALYALSYGIKMGIKGDKIKDYTDYTVYPLEGFWDLSDEGRVLYEKGATVTELKDYLVYKLMIRQPDFITDEVFNKFKDIVYKKKKDEAIQKVIFEVIDEGLSCQMLHIGSYDSEPESFRIMEEYCIQEGYTRASKKHKEIYITDPQRVTPDKLKTTIRFKIKKKS